MTDQSLFCPYCGAQQFKTEARFCHVCGQPIPRPPVGQTAPPSRRGGRGVGYLLLPPILVLLLAAATFAWQRGLLGLSARSARADACSGLWWVSPRVDHARPARQHTRCGITVGLTDRTNAGQPSDSVAGDAIARCHRCPAAEHATSPRYGHFAADSDATSDFNAHGEGETGHAYPDGRESDFRQRSQRLCPCLHGGWQWQRPARRHRRQRVLLGSGPEQRWRATGVHLESRRQHGDLRRLSRWGVPSRHQQSSGRR